MPAAKIVQLKTKTPIEAMIDEIHRLFYAASENTKKAERARIRAGALLIDLQRRHKNGEIDTNKSWWDWYDENFARTRRNAKQVMKIARAENPELASDEEKEQAKQRMRRVREERSSHPVQYILEQIEDLDEQERQQLFAELRRKYAYPD